MVSPLSLLDGKLFGAWAASTEHPPWYGHWGNPQHAALGTHNAKPFQTPGKSSASYEAGEIRFQSLRPRGYFSPFLLLIMAETAKGLFPSGAGSRLWLAQVNQSPTLRRAGLPLPTHVFPVSQRISTPEMEQDMPWSPRPTSVLPSHEPQLGPPGSARAFNLLGP